MQEKVLERQPRELATVDGVIRKLLALRDESVLADRRQAAVVFTVCVDGSKLRTTVNYVEDGKALEVASDARHFDDNHADGNVALLIDDLDQILRERLEKRAERIRKVLGEEGGA